MERNRIKDQFFIDRKGKCHYYKGSDNIDDIASLHAEIARGLFPSANNPEDMMMYRGWILVGSTCYTDPIIYIKATQAQINRLDRLDMYTKSIFPYNNYYINYEKNYNLLN